MTSRDKRRVNIGLVIIWWLETLLQTNNNATLYVIDVQICNKQSESIYHEKKCEVIRRQNQQQIYTIGYSTQQLHG